jgi:hypothetical protein
MNILLQNALFPFQILVEMHQKVKVKARKLLENVKRADANDQEETSKQEFECSFQISARIPIRCLTRKEILLNSL